MWNPCPRRTTCWREDFFGEFWMRLKERSTAELKTQVVRWSWEWHILTFVILHRSQVRDFVAYLFEANMRFFEVAANWVLGLEVDWLKTRAAIWKKTLFSIEMDVGSLWTTKPTAGAKWFRYRVSIDHPLGLKRTAQHRNQTALVMILWKWSCGYGESQRIQLYTYTY